MGWFSGKKKDDQNAGAAPQGNQFLKAVQANAIDRRQYVRIKLAPPDLKAGLPEFLLNGQKVELLDLSLGGMATKAHILQADTPPKTVMNLSMSWYDGKMKFEQKAEFIKFADGQAVFRFPEPHPKFLTEYNYFFKCSLKGAQMGQVKEADLPAGQNLVELWLNPGGDLLAFTSNDHTISVKGLRLRILDSGLFVGEQNPDKTWKFEKPATQPQINDCLHFLLNINKPTTRVQNLLEHFVQKFYRSAQAA